MFGLCVLGLVSIGVLTFKTPNELRQNASQTHPINQGIKGETFVRSDLILPTESFFLPRPELIAQLDNKLEHS